MPRKKIDRVGHVYGRLTVLEPAPTAPDGQAMWLVRCECGTEKIMRGTSFTDAGVRSCGCLRRENNTSAPRDRTGEVYGRLTAIRSLGKLDPNDGGYWWLCRCDCGREVEVRGGSLTSGYTQSCGGHKAETAYRTHGGSGSREYRSWRSMKLRCNNPNHRCYPDYGGRGITVSTEWNASFATFREDMGPMPDGPGWSLDRVDVDGNYEKSNCKWSTVLEQRANQRPRTNNAQVRELKLRIAELEAEIERLRNP